MTPAQTNPASGQEPTPGPGQDPTTPATGQAPETTMTLAEVQAALTAARREAAGHRTRAQVLEKEKADREAASLTEQEKLAKKVTDLSAALAARDYADLQREVAAEHNLPAAMATRLQGKDRDELAADAKALAKLLPAAATSAPPAARSTNPPAGRGAAPLTMADVAKMSRDQINARWPEVSRAMEAGV